MFFLFCSCAASFQRLDPPLSFFPQHTPAKQTYSKIFPKGIYTDVPGFCKVATLGEIAAQHWSLNPDRYVGIDLKRVLNEAPIIAPSPELPKVASLERNTVFICYSHKNKKDFERLDTHLAPLKKSYKLDVWADTRISAGDVWREAVSIAIAHTKVAILLISADFLESEFIFHDELPLLLEAAQNKGAKIIPVLLSPCSFKETLLARFQLLNNKPFSGMNRNAKETTWVRVVESVKEMMGL